MPEDNTLLIEKFLEQRNYLSAYLCLKESSIPREVEFEYTGRIVQDIMNELNYSSGRRNKEKVYFYRSLLLMIFEDIPGLARIYRKQLRMAQEPESPLAFLKHFKALGELTSDKNDLKESIEDTVDDISEKIEDTAEDVNDGKLDESVKDLFSFAEESIKEGLKGFNNFLKNITKSESMEKNETVKEEKEMRKAEPAKEEENSDKNEKEPGNE